MSDETERNRALVTKAYDGLAKGDPTHFTALFAPDIEWRVMGSSAWSKHLKGLEAVQRDLVEPLFARIDGPYLTTAELVLADGDRVAVIAKGNAATVDGGRYDNDYCFVFRMRDGMIAEVREYMDTILADKALGS